MTIALLTMFKDLDTTYSLVNVVSEQLTMLLKYFPSVKILVREDFDFQHLYGIFLDERIEWVTITHSLNHVPFKLYDYSDPSLTLHDTFTSEVHIVSSAFTNALKDIDLCIMHDILFQGWHYLHNIAIRLAQKQLPSTRFVAFTHSTPFPRPHTLAPSMLARFTPMPRTLYAYPTYSGLPLLAKQYGVPEGLCRTVYNTFSSIDYVSTDTQKLHHQFSLLDSHFLIIYPCRLTVSKKLEKVVSLAGALHTASNQSVKVVFCDFPSMDIEPSAYKALIVSEGKKYGLSPDHICFTSDYDFPNGFPRRGILDLFTLSNIFICPSYAESFGLTVLEAASRGNFLILNENVPALYELGSKLHAYFMKWDAYVPKTPIIEHYSPSEESYLTNHAQKIVTALLTDSTLYAKMQIRFTYQLDWIWYHQFEPLIQSALLL